MAFAAFDEDRCAMCGSIIPEGRMVCSDCKQKVNEIPFAKKVKPSLRDRLRVKIRAGHHVHC